MQTGRAGGNLFQEARDKGQTMELSAQQPAAVPPAFAYGELTRFDHFAEEARARGVRVDPHAPDPATGQPSAFDVEVRFQGATRKFSLVLERLDPALILWDIRASAVGGRFEVRITPAHDGGSLLSVRLALCPRGLGSGLLLRALRPIRAGLERRLADRLARQARRLETVLARQGPVRPG